MRKILLALLFSASMIYLPCWIEQANDSFRLTKVSIDVPFNPSWTSEPPSSEIQTLFSGPFHYLGKGAQAFVFESEDGRFVLKLFRGSPKIHPWMHWVCKRVMGKRDRKTALEKIPPLFDACLLAYNQASDLTGLIYLHLNATKSLLPSIDLVNRVKKTIPIDLNKYRFVVQKKGKPIGEVFRDAIENQDKEKCIRLAKSVISLLKERTSRNIGNLDKTLWYNFGFVGETAIEWDFGRYYSNPNFTDPLSREREIRIFTNSLQTFLQQNAPDWSINLDKL